MTNKFNIGRMHNNAVGIAIEGEFDANFNIEEMSHNGIAIFKGNPGALKAIQSSFSEARRKGFIPDSVKFEEYHQGIQVFFSSEATAPDEVKKTSLFQKIASAGQKFTELVAHIATIRTFFN